MQQSLNRRRSNFIESLESRAYFAVDLTGSVSVVAPASHVAKVGQSFTIVVTVNNVGDTAAVGTLSATVSASVNPDGSSPFNSVPLSAKVKIAAGTNHTYKLKFKVPPNFIAGSYYAVANLDPSNVFADSNLSNNVFVSSNTITIPSPYPNMLGLWSGVDKDSKGPDKGKTVPFALDFVTQDGSGNVTANGQIFNADGSVFLDFFLFGTVSTKGVFHADTGGVDTIYVGKVSGSKLTASVHNSTGDAGKVTMTHTA